MLRQRASAVLAAVFASLVTAASANAQFPGDALIEPQSIAIPQDGTGVVSLSLFSGGETLGAAQVVFAYDPDEVEVVSVKPPANPVLAEGFAFDLAPGRLSVVASNGRSETGFAGSQALARVTLRPVLNQGGRILLSSDTEDALTINGEDYQSDSGLLAEIIVTAPGSSAAPAQNEQIDAPSRTVTVSSGPLYERARELAPNGGPVALLVLRDGRAERVLVIPLREGREG